MRGSAFIASSAAIILLLGLVHLVYTFHGSKLQPRDPSLTARMKMDSPGISTQTTIWQVWIGVNASHSLCLILFGTLYGYLAISHSDVLFSSWFLLGTGLALLLAYVALSQLYFFRTPLLAIILATLLYLVGIIFKGR